MLRHWDTDLSWLQKDQPHQQHIPRPVGHQQDDRQPKHLPGFAAGGRVDPAQIDRNPSEAQKKSGTYSKDHVHLHGLAITLEHAKGHTRSGVDKDGRKWTSILPCAYGYIRRVPKGADKDHLDVYLGPHTKAPHVFIIDQLDKDTKKFDEHKIGIGWGSKNQFIQTYKRSFSDGKGAARIGAVHSMTLSQFKQWLEHGDTTLPFKEPERKKLSHKFVGYEPIAAKPNKHCSVCVHYISEEHNGPACVIVASPIDPGAWCRRFRRKS